MAEEPSQPTPDGVPSIPIQVTTLRTRYRLDFQYRKQTNEMVQSLPDDERTWDKQKKAWTVTLAGMDRLLRTCRATGGYTFVFTPEEREAFRQKLDAFLEKRRENGRLLAAITERRRASAGKFKALLASDGLPDLARFLRPGIKPFKHQLAAAVHVAANGSTILGFDMGTGKAQPLDSQILTPEGHKPMGSIAVGDRVINSSGLHSNVIGVYPQGVKDVYSVTFTDGTKVECCGEHLWQVRTPADKWRGTAWRVLSTRQILDMGVMTKCGVRFMVPIVEPVQFTRKEHFIHPYVLGALIGDGSLSSRSLVGFTSADDGILNRMRLHLPEKYTLRTRGDEYGYCLSKTINRKDVNGKSFNLVLDELRRLGLHGHKADGKFIPDAYKYTSVDDRVELLRGLMDTDGTVDKRTGCAFYTTVSPRLKDDVCFLVQSLGGVARISTKIPWYRDPQGIRVPGALAYTISVSLPSSITPFHLDRKKELYKPKTKYKPFRGIKEISPTGSKECQCIAVDSDDHLYVTDGCVLTHNTLSSLLYCESTLPEGARVLVIAPKSLLYNWVNEVRTFTSREVFVMGGRDNPPPAQCRYVVASYSVFSTKDAKPEKVFPPTVTGYDVVICDEAHRLKNHRSLTHTNIKSMLSANAQATGIGQTGGNRDTVWLFLSGTIMPNRIPELYGVLHLLSPLEFPDEAAFLSGFCGMERVKKPWGMEWQPARGFDPAGLHAKLEPYMIRVRKSDVLDLPPKIITDYYLEMDAAQQKLYNQIEQGVLDARGMELESEKEQHLLSTLIRLRQYTSLVKAEYLSGVLPELNAQGHKVIVFDVFKHPLHTLSDKLGGSATLITGEIPSLERSERTARFQDPDSPVRNILLTLAAGKDGLNLTQASYQYMIGVSYVPGENEQAYARSHRIGQTGTVNIFNLVVRGTEDARVLEIARRKQGLIDGVIDGLSGTGKTGDGHGSGDGQGGTRQHIRELREKFGI